MGPSLAAMLVCGYDPSVLLTRWTGEKMDLPLGGLSGPVHIADEYTTSFYQQDGQWAEGPRVQLARRVFKPDGKAEELTFYKPDGSTQIHFQYTFTPAGNLDTADIYNPDGSLKERWVNRYDDAGKIIETDIADGAGKPTARKLVEYDAQGRPIGNWQRDAKGETLGRGYATYDADSDKILHYEYAGRNSTVVIRRKDGGQGVVFTSFQYSEGYKVRSKIIDDLGPQGEHLSRTMYDADGNVTSFHRFQNEFDEHGNVIKSIESNCGTDVLATGDCSPFRGTYREITYFTSDEPPKAAK